VAHLLGYLPYLIGIARKKLFYNVNHRQSTPLEHAIAIIVGIPWLGEPSSLKTVLERIES
jgi:hypothetical protein